MTAIDSVVKHQVKTALQEACEPSPGCNRGKFLAAVIRVFLARLKIFLSELPRDMTVGQIINGLPPDV